MKKKILISLLFIVISVLIALCITFFAQHQEDSSPSVGSTGTTNEIPGTSDTGIDDEIDFEDLLNPDHNSSTEDDKSGDNSPATSDGTKPADPVIPDTTEGGNDGYSNGWY